MNQQPSCCPRFDPSPWDETSIDFEGTLFLKDRVRSLFHIPLNFSAVMKRDMGQITAAGALGEAQVILADENSLWGADVYTRVSKMVPGAQMSRLKGTFESKVFEGPYSQMGQFVSQMKAYLQKKEAVLQKILFYYPLCPKCAKKYGGNYIVLLAATGEAGLQIEDL